MGLIIFNQIQNYLCRNKGIFTWYNGVCECGCEDGKCEGTKAKGYGFKSKKYNKEWFAINYVQD